MSFESATLIINKTRQTINILINISLFFVHIPCEKCAMNFAPDICVIFMHILVLFWCIICGKIYTKVVL